MATNGLEFITKSTFSSVSSHSIDNCFSSNYWAYYIRSQAIGSTTTSVLLRLRSSGVDAATNYSRQYYSSSNTSIGASTGTGETSMMSGYGLFTMSVTDDMNLSECTLMWPYDSLDTMGYLDQVRMDYGGTGINIYTEVSRHASASSYDGMTLTTFSGTMTGEVLIYGYVKS